MINIEDFFKVLKKNGINFYAGVPDSLLKSFCAYLQDNISESERIIAANEGGAVGLAVGHYLACHNPALVYMQNSGQGNSINPLASIADNDVYGIPMILLVGWRGEPGVKDEPQHVKQGKVTKELYEVLGIKTFILSENDWEQTLENAIKLTIANNQPIALIVRKNTFEKYELKNKSQNNYSLSRENAILRIINTFEDAKFISTTGMISRELYELRDKLGQSHENDFLCVGAMGHANQIALGYALSNPQKLVICLDGDGAALMQLGNLAITASQHPENLIHIVLNNGAHDSVGSQPTVGFKVNFAKIAEGCGYKNIFSFTNVEDIEKIKNLSKPIFVEIKVKCGARNDLGRPKHTSKEIKQIFS